VKFAFIKEWRHIWSVGLLCNVMQVNARGFRKWLTRPMSQRQRGDMKVLAHIREQYGLSLALGFG
jgi:putative transposase